MTDNEIMLLMLGFEGGCYAILLLWFAFSILDGRRDRKRRTADKAMLAAARRKANEPPSITDQLANPALIGPADRT